MWKIRKEVIDWILWLICKLIEIIVRVVGKIDKILLKATSGCQKLPEFMTTQHHETLLSSNARGKKILYRFSDIIGILFFYIPHRYKNVSLKNIDIVFGDKKSKEEKDKILRVSYAIWSKNFIETIYYVYEKDSTQQRGIFDSFVIENENYLQEVLKRCEGIVGVSAHIGNFMGMGIYLSKKGYKVNFIIKYPRNKMIAEEIRRVARITQVGLIASKPELFAIRESMSKLKNNEIVIILIDQGASRGDVITDFLGKAALTASGAVYLGLKSSKIVLPLFTVRDKDDKNRIIIESPFELKTSTSKRLDLKENTKSLVKIVEKWILQYPEQWFWFYDRWGKLKDS